MAKWEPQYGLWNIRGIYTTKTKAKTAKKKMETGDVRTFKLHFSRPFWEIWRR